MANPTTQRIVKRTARVAVLSDINAVRLEAAQVIRSFGFREVAAFSNVKELNKYLREPQFDWVITIPSIDSVREFIEMLVECATTPETHSTFFSLLESHGGFKHVENLFALGLLSYHKIELTRDSFAHAIESALNAVQQEHGHSSLIAARFLREKLRSDYAFHEWVKLEKQLVSTFPNNPRNLVQLGLAHLYADQHEQGVTLMAQAVYLNPKLEGLCRQQFEEFRQLKETGIDRQQVDRVSGRKIARCLIVDPDPAVRKQLTQLMESLRIPLIYSVEDGEEAWTWIQVNKAPELLITEWRLPRLSGMALIQRLRSAGYYDTGVCVVSSLVKREDAPLLNEMSVAHLITKPVQQDDAILGLRWMLRQEKRPTEQRALERKITLAISAGRIEEAEQSAAAYYSNPKIAEGRKTLVRAQLAYAHADYPKAVKLVETAIRQSGADSLPTISLLAQSLLKQGDNLAALRCFEKAQSINPRNIQRLCALAELHLSDGHSIAADQMINQARKIDAKNQTLISTETKAAILNPARLQDARELMKHADARADIVGFMNNRAVALINEGRYGDACQLYQRTLEALPEDEQRLVGVVHYNLGLAHARHEKLVDARTALQKSLQTGSDQVKAKATSLLERVDAAIANGTRLVLRFSDRKNQSLATDIEWTGDQLKFEWHRRLETVKPGSYGLLNIVELDFRDAEIERILRQFSPADHSAA